MWLDARSTWQFLIWIKWLVGNYNSVRLFFKFKKNTLVQHSRLSSDNRRILAFLNRLTGLIGVIIAASESRYSKADELIPPLDSQSIWPSQYRQLHSINATIATWMPCGIVSNLGWPKLKCKLDMFEMFRRCRREREMYTRKRNYKSTRERSLHEIDKNYL